MKRSLIAGLMVIGGLYPMCFSGLAEEKRAASEMAIPSVVAKVNGKAITAQRYQRLWDQMVMERGGQASIKEPKAQEALKQDVLERLIALELLAQKTEQMNVQVGPKEVEQKAAEVEMRIGGKDALDNALKAMGLTRTEYLADLEKSLQIQRLLQQEVFESITVDPNQVERFYESNPKVFEKPEELRARHIVIRVPEDATDEKRQEAKDAIEKAAERIKGGEPFEAVAKEISQDGAASKGGDLGYFPRGRMVPSFEKVAFTLEKGQVSQVVETRFGYHLIKVEDKRPPRTISFEEAKSKIVAYLKRKKEEEGVREYIEGLRAKAKIEKTAF